MMNALRSLVYWIFEQPFFLYFLFYCFRKDIPILMVHGVKGVEPDDQWMPSWGRTDPLDFDRNIEWLSQHFNFIGMNEAVHIINGVQKTKRNSIVLTFDDGYLNFLSHAKPILDRHKIPATMYVATHHICSGEPYWIDRLDYALQQQERTKFEVKCGSACEIIDNTSRSSYVLSYRKLRLAIKEAFEDDSKMLSALDCLIKGLELTLTKKMADFPLTDYWSAILTTKQLTELGDYVEVGGHTVNHKRLDHLSLDETESEVKNSKIFLDDLFSGCDFHFCYPNGSYDSKSENAVRNAGYISAVSVRSGINTVGSNLFSLKRISFPDAGSKGKVLFQIYRACWH